MAKITNKLGAGFDQDNIKKEILINCPLEPTLDNFLLVINSLPVFTVGSKEIPTFKAVSADVQPITYYIELLNIGRGNYGISGTQLVITNLKLTSFNSTVGDIVDIPTTQTIDLGSSTNNVSQVLNVKNPPVVIQNQLDGYTLIKIVESTVPKTYLWIGDPGTYGQAATQSVIEDFQLLTESTTVSDATTTNKGIIRLGGDLAGTANLPTVPALLNKVNKSGVEVNLPILDGSNEEVGYITHSGEIASFKGNVGTLLDSPSTRVSNLSGYTDYVVGIGLNGQLIPVKKESTSSYAPIVTYSTPQVILANTTTELGAVITLTQVLISPTLQWSVNFNNTTNQTVTVGLRLGLNNVPIGATVNYTVPRFTSTVLTGASPYNSTLNIGQEVSAYISSTGGATVNSITLKLDSGIQSATVDQTIIDGSTNAVSGNAVFDGLALKANLSGGNTFTGIQNFNGTISTGTGIAITTNSSGVPNGNYPFSIDNSGSSGSGMFINNTNGGTGAYFESYNGKSIRVDVLSPAGNGIGILLTSNIGNIGDLMQFPSGKINYQGNITAPLFIKNGAPSTNILLAGGTDIPQSTFALAATAHNPITLGTANGLSLATQVLSLGLAGSGSTGSLSSTDFNNFAGKFNTPTGLTTNYLPKWNGSGFGNSSLSENSNILNFNISDARFLGGTSSSRFIFGNSTTSSYIELGGSTYSTANSMSLITVGAPIKFFPGASNSVTMLENGRVLINTTTDDLTNQLQVNGTISASPAVNSNQVVVKSQLDAFVPSTTVNLTGNQTKAGVLSFSNYMVLTTDNGLTSGGAGGVILNKGGEHFAFMSAPSTGSSGQARLDTKLINASSPKTFTFPDQSGTFALALTGYTVATLPTGSIGMTAYVTNALSPVSLAAVVGGGAVVVRVFHNGVTWIVQ